MHSARHPQTAERKEGRHQQSRSMLSKMPNIGGLPGFILGQNRSERLPKE